MADELSESQLAEMEQAFFSIDKDNSTEISIEELEIVMQSLGLNPTATELRLMISEVDADDSGTIDFPEFVTMLAVRMKDTANEHRIKEIFQLFDKDEDGQISHNELNNMMLNLGEKLTDDEIQDMLKEADIDGDGHVSQKDFLRLIMAPVEANKKFKQLKKKTKQKKVQKKN